MYSYPELAYIPRSPCVAMGALRGTQEGSCALLSNINGTGVCSAEVPLSPIGRADTGAPASVRYVEPLMMARRLEQFF
jgi:hypothetical protein